MSDKTRQALEYALQAHISDEMEDKNALVSEWVIMTATQFMDPERAKITSYSWWCTMDIPQGHILGLIEIGSSMIKENLNEP